MTIEKSKFHLVLAILLGLLTFVTTPLVSSLYLFFKPEGFSLIHIIADVIGPGELSFIAAVFIVESLWYLAGDAATAAVSWSILRSRRLAAVTFVSALAMQIVMLSIVLSATHKHGEEMTKASIADQKAYEQYAVLGTVSARTDTPFTYRYALNGQVVEESLFKKLILSIPVTVSHPGPYEITLRYSDDKIGALPFKDITKNLAAGDNTVEIEFQPDESREYGYVPPESAHGQAEIQLFYLVPRREIMNAMRAEADSRLEKAELRIFLKSEEGADPDAMINRFITRKEIRF